jgi:hypothetical protein
MLTLYMSMYKRQNFRTVAYSYKQIKEVFKRLDWEIYNDPLPKSFIVHVRKTFNSEAEAIQGRKNLDTYLRKIHPKCEIYMTKNPPADWV